MAACSSNGFSPEASSPTLPSDTPTADVILPAQPITTLSTPYIEHEPDDAITESPSYPESCGYQWAYQDLPELSTRFLQSLQALQPEAKGYAFVFGENCIGQDGTTVLHFIPMETDFNVTIVVKNISNKTELGEWIIKVMQEIEVIPSDQIVGPRPGRVTLIFQAAEEQTYINFYIDQYQALPTGLRGAEIYQSLLSPQ